MFTAHGHEAAGLVLWSLYFSYHEHPRKPPLVNTHAKLFLQLLSLVLVVYLGAALQTMTRRGQHFAFLAPASQSGLGQKSCFPWIFFSFFFSVFQAVLVARAS